MIDINNLYRLFLNSNDISIDSRYIRPNDFFVGLKGNNTNGSVFAKAAISKGAFCAIVDDIMYEDEESNIFFVEDTLKMLQDLARLHRQHLNIPIIAITGTNGKTTSKDLISKVLSQKYSVFSTRGNLNNHIGVPLTILSIKENNDIAVIEMGASKRGDIKELCEIAMPNYGYITNFGKAHLEEFLSVENIIRTKLELYDFIKDNKGLLFVNNSDEIQIANSIDCRTYTFGENTANDVVSKLMSVFPYLKLNIDNQDIQTKMMGDYNYYNIVSSYAIGRYFGVKIEDIISALSFHELQNNRTQIKKVGNTHFILDCYNANPSSMMASLKNFNNNIVSREKIVILGDMLELGVSSAEEHRAVLRYISESQISKSILIGKEFQALRADFKGYDMSFFSSFEEYSKEATFNNNEAYYLIKGSRGMHLERIIDLLNG